MKRMIMSIAALLLVLSAGQALAQSGVTEIGFDMAFSYETESELFGISLPVGGQFETLTGPQGGVRAGFFLSDAVAIEPATSFSLLSGNDDSATAWAFATKLQYHFSTDPTQPRMYVAVGGTFTLFDFSSLDSVTQFGLAGDIGVKLPINEHAGARLAASYTRGFSNDDLDSRNILAALIGISVYLGN